MSRTGNERAHGPYKHGNKWRIVYVSANGQREVVSHETYANAYAEVQEAKRQAGGRSVDMAVSAFLDSLKDGVQEGTLITNGHRLRAFLRLPAEDAPLVMLDAKRAQVLYSRRVLETRADTHRNELALVTRAAQWWVKSGYLPTNPFKGVEAVGKRRRGKPQLRIDEARSFVSTALDEYITTGDLSGLACVTTLLLGLRASECTDRLVRDLDDGGRVLWIPHGKTEAAIRQMQVPAVIRPLLLDVATGKAPQDKLWGDVDRHWIGHHVRRLCKKAGVPVIPPHGLRGLHATLALGGGSSPDVVARSLGHVNADITRRHYFADGAEAQSQSTSVIDVVILRELSVPNGEVRGDDMIVTPRLDSCAKGDSNPHGVTH